MRKPTNPFILSGYHSPAYFCDRENEFSWLLEQFQNERNVVLHSWRRTGKSALVRHFFNHLEAEKMADCIYVDLLGTSSLPEANKRLASAIIHQLVDLKQGIGSTMLQLLRSIGATVGLDPLSGTPQLSFGFQAPGSIENSFEALGAFLAEREHPVIICLDEFQQITHYAETNVEAIFRTWVQQYPMIRFIFSGSHRHLMISMFSEASRPFYRSAEVRALEPIHSAAYSAFISTKFKAGGKKIAQSHIDGIFQWTRKQTYYVQLVCNHLYGKTDEVTDDWLADVFDGIIQQEIPLLSGYQSLLTTYQWRMLCALAKAENTANPTSQEFLVQYELGAASSARTALNTLLLREFVILQDKKYTLHDTLLMRWIQTLV